MNEIVDLIEKHRANGLLIDANLLILCLIGRLNRRRIANFERTSSFSEDDYETLERLISEFRRTITTPHILTEVSNLTTKMQHRELLRVRELLRDWIGKTLEIYEGSSHIAADPVFQYFGLTDAAISSLCRRDGVLLITADVPLYGALANKGLEAISFRQIQAWKRLR